MYKDLNGNVQIPEIVYFLIPSKKNVRSPMEKGLVKFSITFQLPGGNSVKYYQNTVTLKQL